MYLGEILGLEVRALILAISRIGEINPRRINEDKVIPGKRSEDFDSLRALQSEVAATRQLVLIH